MKEPHRLLGRSPVFDGDETARECLRALSAHLCKDGTCVCLDPSPLDALAVTDQVILVVDRNHRVLYLSPAGRQRMGIPASLVLGMHCRDVLRPSHPCESCIFFRPGSSEHTDFWMDASGWNGKRRRYLHHGRLLEDATGRTVGAIAVLTDVGDLQAQTVLEHLHQPHCGPSFFPASPMAGADEPGLEDPRENPLVFHGILSCSRPMRALVQRMKSLALQDVPICIEGESGVGKELAARALHLAGPRASRPFHAINCASLHEDLLESELFGHERGAFTGATERRIGWAEHVADGTLLLDEVGCLGPRAQAKLLRLLENREFERLGGSRTLRFRARILSATNADLREMVHQGTFRQDLYYRLCVVPLRIPPLRERLQDILPLARVFLESGWKSIQGTQARPPVLEPETEALLQTHAWPGNVRELRNAVLYALSMSDGKSIRPADLPPELTEQPLPPLRFPAPQVEEPRLVVSRGTVSSSRRTPGPDRQEILDALVASQFRHAVAARRLGISRTTLWRRLKSLDSVDDGSRTE